MAHIEAWMIDDFRRIRSIAEAEAREFASIPIGSILRYEICGRCHGKGCDGCGGRGTAPVALVAPR